ncbi:hypothetical protein K3495_g6817 [Podosphaera aphanis]|nr:hypothetical protein K3495_g6817 [Podosphaera aphanis]
METLPSADASAKSSTAKTRLIATPKILRVKGAQKGATRIVDPNTDAAQVRRAGVSTVPRKTTYAGEHLLLPKHPPELLPLLEAEKRRAAELATNLQIATAAMKGVGNALFPLVNGQNRTFVDSMRVYHRAAIAQFTSNGLGASAPIQPARPANNITYWQRPPPGSSINQPIQIADPIAAEPKPKPTWATITSRKQKKILDAYTLWSRAKHPVASITSASKDSNSTQAGRDSSFDPLKNSNDAFSPRRNSRSCNPTPQSPNLQH